jgi:hypothetical protein
MINKCNYNELHQNDTVFGNPILGSLLSSRSGEEGLCAVRVRLGLRHLRADGLPRQPHHRRQLEPHGHEVDVERGHRHRRRHLHPVRPVGPHRGRQGLLGLVVRPKDHRGMRQQRLLDRQLQHDRQGVPRQRGHHVRHLGDLLRHRHDLRADSRRRLV